MGLPHEYPEEILENISDGFIAMDDGLIVLYFNSAAEKMLNRRREDILNKNLFDAFPEINGSVFEEKYVEIVQKKEPLFFETYFEVAPYTNWYEVRAYPSSQGYHAFFSVTTNRKQAEDRLRRSENLYHDLVETSQDLIWQCDAEGRYTYLNPAWEEVFGYTVKEMLGEKFTKFQSRKYAERDEKEFFQLLKGNTLKSYETVHLGKDGNEIHLIFNAKFLIDEFGKISGTRGIAYDVTERKKSESEFIAAKKFNETILSATPDVIYVYDIVEKKNIYANEGIEKVLGYTVSEIERMGENVIEILMHPDDLDVYIRETLTKYQELEDNQLIEHEYRMKHKSGNWIWLRSKESVFLRNEDGSPKQIFGIVSDINKQKITEARIRKSEEEYRSLFNQMLDGCALHEIICDDQGNPVDYRFLSINPSFEKLTGLKASELSGRNVLDVLPETEKHWIDTYGRVALTGEPVSFENYAQALDKHFRVTAYRPAEKQFACIFQDITHLKKAEEERKKIEAHLRQAHKMEAIGTLAGGIAHDFNNILAAIIGFADMAKDDIPEWNPARLQIDEVLKAGNRAKGLVKQILAFSRKKDQSRLPVKIHTLVKEAMNFLRATIPTTIDIQHDFDPQCGNILADSTQIHQVLMNLFTNASHAMEADGGTLKISLKKVHLCADFLENENGLKPGPYVALSVEDTGAGIKREHLEKIFDPYFTTKGMGEGSGMGLSVVHGIVKNHGAMITVDSTPFKGTTFEIFFPEIENEVEEVDVGESFLPAGKEHLLLVDDDHSIINLTRRRLEKLGYQTTATTKSQDALEYFSADPQKYDLVITDQTMPIMTGERLAMILRSIRNDIPIIMCTGYSSKIDADRADSIGINAFLMKPVDRKTLAEVVRQVLDAS